jgi:hypothetical protein
MEDIRDAFGEETGSFARQHQGRGFAVRLFGGAFEGVPDAVVLGDVLGRLGRAGAWFNNALFGRRTVPSVGYAAAIRSVVIQFTAGSEEEIYRADGDVYSPTAISGRWMGSLLEYDEATIWEAAATLRPRATGTYLSALEAVAEREGGVEWLVLDGEQPRVVRASRGSVVDTIDVLAQPVRTVARVENVTGILYAADQYGHTFKMDVTDGGEFTNRTIRGSYSRDANATLEGAWRKLVDATIRVIEPERAGMPRSPSTRFELVGISNVHMNATVPVEPPSVTQHAA